MLNNGENHTATKAAAGQTDSWTFTATLGDALLVAIGEVSGSATFTPWIRLVAPNGTTIGNNWNAAAAQIEVAASATGTYTVLVASADAGNLGTGDYRLTLAKAPGAFVVSAGDHGGPATNGAMHTGSIVVGDMDMWSITANQGNAILVGMGEIAGSADFTPWIRVIAPNGAIIGNNWNAAAAQVQVAAPVTGTYTVVVSTADAGYDGSGDYRLTLVIAPGAIVVTPGDSGGGPMTNGAMHAGSIPVGDLDAWTFTANQGNAIMLGVGEIAGTATFTPWIRLIAPNGAVIGNNWNAAAAQVQVAAPATGTYTVVVSTANAGYDGTGDYRLTLAKAPGAFTESPGDQSGALGNGANKTGSIPVGDLDMFRFTASQGHTIVVSMGEVSGSADFTPWIRLVAPNGTIVGNNWNAAAAQIQVAAPSNGTYTVIVSTADAGYDGTGNYRLTLAKAPGTFSTPAGDQGGAMKNGANYTGSVVVGDLDMWRISANQGDAIVVSLGEVTGTADFTPWIRLVAPNGAIIGTNWNVTAAQIQVAAPSTGSYTVIVGTADAGYDATGSYRITVAHAPDSILIVPAGDQGGPMTNVVNHMGSIPIADLDQWTLSATQGSTITLTITEVAGSADYTPWIRLVASNGAIIGNSWGVSGAQITVAAPSTGKYTVIVSTADAGYDATGDYRLTVTGAN